MNHKRGKPKNARAGCLMCKPQKVNGGHKLVVGKTGFGKIRDEIHARNDLAKASRAPLKDAGLD